LERRGIVTGYALQRPIIVALAALGIAFALTGTATASSSSIPMEVAVVSSTQLGLDSFTMTATNVGDAVVDLDLAAPGVVSDVTVDFGSFNGRWLMEDLGPGAMATMTGQMAN